MTSGMLTGLMLIALSTTSPAQVNPAQLLQNLDLTHERLAFSETRRSDLLTEPLEITGELWLRNNQALERKTLTPFRETQTLATDYVEVRKPNGHRRRFSLHRAPELAALREVLLAVMSKNPDPLDQAFEMKAFGQPDAWSLELRPRPDHIAEKLEVMVLSGTNQHLEGLELILTNGERIQTRFHPNP